MAKLKEPQIKQLTASAAVTTDNKAGILHYVYATGDTAGDKIEINDGTTTRITLLIPSANGSVHFPDVDAPKPTFDTDIDCVITKSGNVFVTFVYTEIEI